jgi:hypothetical protein
MELSHPGSQILERGARASWIFSGYLKSSEMKKQVKLSYFLSILRFALCKEQQHSQKQEFYAFMVWHSKRGNSLVN